MEGGIFQFKITLNASVPRIWRRILVPADYTFFDLQCAIQDAMGWGGGHLHTFYIEEQGAKKQNSIAIALPDPDYDDDFILERRDERIELIADYFGKIIKQCVYAYDFGDDWNHTVLFERVVPRMLKKKYPQCVVGKNACPPEDCGGVWGYINLQEILKNPKHCEYADMIEWLGMGYGEYFNPHEFNLEEVDFENPKKYLAEWKLLKNVLT